MRENGLRGFERVLCDGSAALYIKSKMLLPKQEDEDEEDPRAELAARLLEYQKCKQAAEKLKEREFYYKYMFFKSAGRGRGRFRPRRRTAIRSKKLMEAFL